MLAPPNHGSEIVDRFREFEWFGKAMGPAALELGTEKTSLPNSFRPLRIPVGIIAGTVSSDPWFASLFSGPNDGKVSVESAKLPEMTDFRALPAGHTFIMRSEEAIGQTLYFFENLRFK
ncbi:MAG TPA: alpha/beta hydrolase, partial [Pseudobdellovibrionaceae bacterium]|nr:alpha/beta hydrolase [Pseudobdellovibrionaceae bacterium]